MVNMRRRGGYFRLMWFCFTSAGAIATMIIISSLWEKFQTNPTITGLDTDFHSWSVSFPTITLCDHSSVNPEIVNGLLERQGVNTSSEQYEYYKNFYNLLGSLSFDNIDQISNYTEDANLPQSDFRKVLFEVVYHCEDLYFDCEWKADNYDCCQGFLPIFTEIGFCYIFNSRHALKSWPWMNGSLPPFHLEHIHETDSKWSLKFNSRHIRDSPHGIYIHSDDEIPGWDMLPHFVWTGTIYSLLFSVKQTYTTEDAMQLSIKQRRCMFPHEIHLKLDDTYTYYTCTRQCRMESARQICGCVPFFYPEIDDFKYCTLKELQCIADNKDKIIHPSSCYCELSCFNTVYEVEKLLEPESKQLDDGIISSLEISFVSWPMVRYKREVIFGWVDLLVSFGGIAGLFLGFSLLSGVEIIYYFTIRACCMVYRNKDTLRRLQREYDKRQIPNYDLSLVPYFVKPAEPGSGIRTLQMATGITLPSNQIQPFKSRLNAGYPPTKKAWHTTSPFGIDYLP